MRAGKDCLDWLPVRGLGPCRLQSLLGREPFRMRRDAIEKCATRASKKNWPESDSIVQNQPGPQRMSRLLKVFRSERRAGGLEACFHLSSKVPTHWSSISRSSPWSTTFLVLFHVPGRNKLDLGGISVATPRRRRVGQQALVCEVRSMRIGCCSFFLVRKY